MLTPTNLIRLQLTLTDSPGRFFVNHELKMLLAYMVLNYDVQYLPERPPNKWFGQNVVPDMKVNIKVRRRVGAVQK